jgi:short-subunit dehydrogenase
MLDKYAVVTGASSGIGWHISKELAARGYSIVAVSNQSENLTKLKSELQETYGNTIHTIDCDLSTPDAAEIIYNFCSQRELQVEVLVNNAGMLVYGEAMTVDMKRINTILNLHMNTPVLLCRFFGAHMAENKKGYILNISSISAAMPYPTISLYGPTKNFLRGFTRALRSEMKGSGVSVSCLIPGATATALYDTAQLNVPLLVRLGIMMRPENVARAGVNALFRGKAERVPGLINNFILLFIPLIPHALVGYIYKKRAG